MPTAHLMRPNMSVETDSQSLRQPSSPPTDMRPSRHGYSLIELMLVMSISAVLLAITVPAMVVVHEKFQARGASRRFALAHSLTRATAIQQGGIAELHIDASANQFWVQVDTGGTGSADTVSFHSDLPDALTLTANRSRVCFDGRGLSTTRAGCESGDLSVSFDLGGYRQQVRATVLGKLLR